MSQLQTTTLFGLRSCLTLEESFNRVVSFYTSDTVQLCAQVERWTYSGNYITAGASAIASWSLNVPSGGPEARKTSVKTRSLQVARRLEVKIGCSATCDLRANARLIRPGNDLGFGAEPVTIRIKPTQYGLLFVTLSPGGLRRLTRQWRPSELRVFGTATFADGTTKNFFRNVQFRRPPRPKPSHHGGCTPGYSPCIPPGPDVDCEGGGGNGPRYVQGPVTVTGSDPYGLDADGDGIGCDT